jgi:hypothetical protein
MTKINIYVNGEKIGESDLKNSEHSQPMTIEHGHTN